MIFTSDSFLKDQRRYKRFRVAEKEALETVQTMFKEKELSFPNTQLFIRVFKKEERVELWAYSEKKSEYVLVKYYEVCEQSGELGPKRKEGDRQVPEGVYFIDRFNPFSDYYLSLGINYPNASDKILGDKKRPGGDIFIHGRCVTIGCIPIEDDPIKELYLICVYAKNSGQKRIPVHIFPTVMNTAGMDYLAEEADDDDRTRSFWENLRPVYLSFQNDKQLNKITITALGRYIVHENL